MDFKLPTPFEAKMKSLLGDEFDPFKRSYDQIPHAGIRINTLKIGVSDFTEISPFELEPIPWCKTGFYVKEGARPGLHPYYHAGLYYIQEPSAMAPVELLGVEPGDRVLDLCAAPGGKSTQIAAKLCGSGHLVSNDLHPDRTKALAKNLEMYGVRNAVVLNESPERIAEAFPRYFNKILIDAPCSGEGMFRKDEDMLKYWEEASPLKYAAMQKEILASAAKMLSAGGTMVYSTCTFSPEENEGIIAAFLKDHSEFSVVPIGDSEWFSPGEAAWLEKHGLPEWGLNGREDAAFIAQTAGTGRLWPHRVKGEGHFMAVLRKSERPEEDGLPYETDLSGGGAERTAEAYAAIAPAAGKPKSKLFRAEGGRLKKGKGDSGMNRHGGRNDRAAREGGRRDRTLRGDNLSGSELLGAFHEFMDGQLHLDITGGYPVLYGQNIYLSPVPEERLKGLKTVRAGWYMGQAKNGRFVPGHPLATALRPEEAGRVISLSSKDGEAVRYLKGETLEIPEERVRLGNESVTGTKGFVLVCIDGYAAGWGKWQSGLLKNEYPAGWRWTSV
ncbi:RsmB/NOP family class I SAM-dependent RNA methyltransferase [Paenibacillus sp. DMB20]|uniref:RsmB/NOP family class I SAM-dependent RNA methyltransferase n=1 Tax=Paenibacillus sp. DMB20 TaxID=1642570 RepID=UPI00062819BA|nr:RsmB/NOP family class I SAM-dependent RNA methyltransferase [Paenibacillus sp. DMB20]KKO52781.1 rRNA cytosine-C5-methyltransferase [Paenibacillus sp. DMB20]